jgi:hypothetical protein
MGSYPQGFVAESPKVGGRLRFALLKSALPAIFALKFEVPVPAGTRDHFSIRA